MPMWGRWYIMSSQVDSGRGEWMLEVKGEFGAVLTG